MRNPVAVVGAVLLGCAVLIVGIAWTGSRHPAPLPVHPPVAGTMAGFPVLWQVERDPAVLADAERQVDEARAGLEQRAAQPLACFVSHNCIHDLQPRATFDAERAAGLAAVSSKGASRKAAEDAWHQLSSTYSSSSILIEAADGGGGFGLYLVVALLVALAGVLALRDRYGLAMIALVVAFFPAGVFVLLTKAPLIALVTVLLPLGGVALLYAQGVGGGELPPFFASFEASLAGLPAAERGARIRREIALGAVLAIVGVVVLGGMFLVANAAGSPIVIIAPGLFAFGLLRALRGVIAARPARA